MYVSTLVLCQASIFSLYGQANSTKIFLFSLLEEIVMSGLSLVRWKRKSAA